MANQPPIQVAAPPRGWRWLWGFLIAVPVVLVAGIVALIAYNTYHRLTREKLDAAVERWNAHGSADYDMTVEVTGGSTGTYEVQVRGGRAARVTRDGVALASHEEQPATQEQLNAWSVRGLFQILQNDLDNDIKEGRTAFTRADFDEHNGRLVKYIRASGRNTVIIHVVSFQPVE